MPRNNSISVICKRLSYKKQKTLLLSSVKPNKFIFRQKTMWKNTCDCHLTNLSVKTPTSLWEMILEISPSKISTKVL